MKSVFVMLWDPGDSVASWYAKLTASRARSHVEFHADHIECPGLFVLDVSTNSNKGNLLALRGTDGEIRGAIFGTLFEATSEPVVAPRVHKIPSEKSAELLNSEGRSLTAQFWGSYIGILDLYDRKAVVTDPTSSIPCFWTRRNGVTLVFSHLERCPFIEVRDFTIDYDFIAWLIVYDKLQTGATGLNEVKELLGGQRLVVAGTSTSTECLWDPRTFAVRSPRLSPECAAKRLKSQTIAAVNAWGNCYDRILVELSGGLDSSIVLSCLASQDRSKQVEAVHYLLVSDDADEIRYAAAAASSVEIELQIVRVDPKRAIPNVSCHPATVRPYRQFTAQNFTAELDSEFEGRVDARFTGQGGDHLFLAPANVLGFSDHILDRGLGKGTLDELLNTARLTEKSVWRVLGEAVPALMRRGNATARLEAILQTRKILGDRQSGTRELGTILPQWALDRGTVAPGKFEQVVSLLHMVHTRQPFEQIRGCETINPLVSQPLIEFCLSVPTYLLRAHGISRGLARLAFEGGIPDCVRLRPGKGDASRYFVENLMFNRERIVEALVDGEMVKNGLLAKEDVLAFMRESLPRTHEFGRMMLVYYAIEARLQTWRSVLRSVP